MTLSFQRWTVASLARATGSRLSTILPTGLPLPVSEKVSANVLLGHLLFCAKFQAWKPFLTLPETGRDTPFMAIGRLQKAQICSRLRPVPSKNLRPRSLGRQELILRRRTHGDLFWRKLQGTFGISCHRLPYRILELRHLLMIYGGGEGHLSGVGGCFWTVGIEWESC